MRPLSQAFEILRARVEARAELPAFVLISAAERGDGTTSVACGLARSFAESGKRTLLVDANTAHSAVAEELGVRPLPPLSSEGVELGARNDELPRLCLATVAPDGEHEMQLGKLLRRAREHFTVIVVDAGALPACSVALHLARCADAILLAVRLGRHSSDNDTEAVRLAGERLIGVVTTRARGPRNSGNGTTSPHVVAARRAIIPTAGAVR